MTNKNKMANANNKNTVDFTFGFTDAERQLMFMHFNGLKVTRQIVVNKETGRKTFGLCCPQPRNFIDKEVFLSELKETYTLNGYDFDWNSFEEKIMSIRQDNFIRLIKYLMIEWVSFPEFVYAFYTFGVDVEDWMHKEVEELNNN